ncbi:SET domain-containing protein-lysine N-methyltransferase [Candidatus Microgenomates bacterium]|nr:MAG: SET domain-containing protein-lysine N-methyltransferase [Candidatus Microgenomates bacterium]
MKKDIVIKNSKINKKGVFAAKDFKKGEIVLKWNPKILDESEVEKLTVNKKHYIEPAGKGKYFLMQSPEKYVNHSCDANTFVKNNFDIAIRAIKKGEEITSCYKKGSLVSFICNCGSGKCKRIIKDS